MRIFRKQKNTTGKPARGRRPASTDTTFSGSLLALESRIMFDGAAVATVSTVTSEQFAQSQADAFFGSGDVTTADRVPVAPTGAPLTTIGDQALFDALTAYDTSTARQEILFLSPSVRDYQDLLDGISSNVEVFVLDPTRDGVAQMAEVLAGRTGVDAIHLIGDGTEAEMHLGASFLTQESISTTYAHQFQQIGQSLSQNADLLIYGCNFGRGEGGQGAIQTLAALTGADVVASTDRTGHVSEYADWQLEVHTGLIETSIVIGESTQAAWNHALATYTVTNTNDSGANSLRQAILDANGNAGADTIAFNINGGGLERIRPNSALPTITGMVTIDGWSQPGFAGTPLIELRGDNAGASVDGLTFSSTSDGSVVRGLVIFDYTRDGIVIQSGADNITIVGNWIGTTGTGTTGDGNGDDGIDIAGSGAIVGGTGANDRNVITNNSDEGITIVGSGVTGHLIQGNYIGVDPDGATGNGNTDVGLAIISGTGNTIGGTTAAARNVISKNNEGMEINTSNNVVQGNNIGTDVTGTLNRGNRIGSGVQVQGSSTNNLIGGTAVGASNLIAFNAGNGVDIVNGTGHAVLGNQIHSNTLLGINLGAAGVTANDVGDGDAGANNLQNFPVLTSAQVVSSTQLTVVGTLNSTASSQFRIEFFSSAAQDGTGFGEGQTYLGFVNVTTNGSGNASFNTTLTATVSAGSYISATATKSDVTFTTFTDTSEFAQNAVAANTAPVLDASKSPALAAENEDAGAPSGAVGTLVSSLVDFAAPAGQVDNVTDPDAGALLGIAVTAADTTNGTWFYTTNNGGAWSALGAVSNASARLLAADANTRLYFQPNADYNGTLTNAITFQAWDQTSGTNGGLAAVGSSNTVLDNFAAVSYANNNGSQTWTTNWVETDFLGGGASSGDIQVTGGQLRLEATGDRPSFIYRQADLSSASTATLSLAFNNTLGAGDRFDLQVSSNGGASYTTLSGGVFSSSSNTGSGTLNFDITPYIASNTQVRFIQISDGVGSFVSFDNVQISYTSASPSGAFSSSSDTASLVVTAVNDAPVATITPLTYAATEQVNLTLHGTGLSVADVDAGAASLTATLSVGSGILTVGAGTTGVTVGGSGTGTVTLTGTLAQINNLLAGNLSATAVYNANTDAPPSSTVLTLSINDGGNTGTGGALVGSDTATINITATGTEAAGFLTIWPCGEPQPNASNLNYEAGATIANTAITKMIDIIN